ncbi:MAG TPA: hypothetical protein VGM73_08615 [Candidatus Didemnitutus sp.]|jgi:hypothetical protein
MSGIEITDKLNRFLTRHDPMTEECHAVYLMVELRKLLDQHAPPKAYPLLRFYCDWTVHCQKDRNIAEIEATVKAMYAAAAHDITTGKGAPNGPKEMVEFASMSDLRGAIGKFLQAEHIVTTIVDNNTRWERFVALLTEVLAHQPVVIDSDTVKGIQFSPRNRSFVMSFNRPVAGRSSYRTRR